MFWWILILLFLFLLAMLILVLFTYPFPTTPIQYPVYCISLSDEKERKKHMSAHFKNITYFDAVDTRSENWRNYMDLLTPNAIQQLEDSQLTKLRSQHYELSPGAVGCFLSHIELYKKLLQSPKNIFLILEDDSVPSKNFEKELKKILKNYPSEMDLFLLNHHVHTGTLEPKRNKKLKYHQLSQNASFYFTNCYLITKSGIQKILNQFENIEWQIDSWYSLLNSKGKLKIACSDTILCPQSHDFRTSIQIYNVRMPSRAFR